MLTPRPYQLAGRDFLARTRIALLADEMRVGKTPQAILAAREVFADDALVLCPAIAVPMWRSEWARWQGSSSPTVLSYEKALLKRDELLAHKWDVTIIDECHFAGNPEAQRTKLIYGKGGLVWCSKQLWALSGTPAPKHAGSLWPILRAAGVIGMAYDDFIRRYCRIDWVSQRPVGTKEEHIPELKALWQQIGLRRTRKEVAPDMPEIGFEFLPVDLKVDLPLQSFSGGPLGNRAQSDDELLATLERNANTDREDRVAVSMAKVSPLLEEVEFALANGLLKQTIIFGWHIEPLKKITASLKAMGFNVEMLYGETSESKRVEIQERFRLGLLDAVVGQIRACGTAISLPCKHGYFLELDWVPANNAQAAARLLLLEGEPVTMDVVTMPGSVDDRVQKVLLQRARELAKLF